MVGVGNNVTASGNNKQLVGTAQRAEGSYLTPQVWKDLERLFTEATHALRQVSSHATIADIISYTHELHFSSNLTSAAELPVLRELRSSEQFRFLVGFVCDNFALRSLLFGNSKTDISEEDMQDPLFKIYLESLLLRIISMIDFQSNSKPLEDVFENLFSFLSSEKFPRHVHVPLMNLRVPPGAIAIHGLGVVSATSAKATADPNLSTRVLAGKSVADLMFVVETDHFIAARFFPLASEIKRRIALLRIAVHPFVSYNHFFLQHIKPWEQHVPDTELWDRFWAEPKRNFQMPVGDLRAEQAWELEAMQENFDAVPWDEFSPWRLAVGRLDDAVFKLECGSPDAILDITIALEALYVESESRQESTHKIATRAARYLGTTKETRQRISRDMKHVYKARSTLAHGQHWEIDEKTLAQVLVAGNLLTQTLRRMVEEKRTQLNLADLDLA